MSAAPLPGLDCCDENRGVGSLQTHDFYTWCQAEWWMADLPLQCCVLWQMGRWNLMSLVFNTTFILWQASAGWGASPLCQFIPPFSYSRSLRPPTSALSICLRALGFQRRKKSPGHAFIRMHYLYKGLTQDLKSCHKFLNGSRKGIPSSSCSSKPVQMH